MVPYTLRLVCVGLGASVLLSAGCEIRGVIGDNRGMDGDGGVLDDGAGDGATDDAGDAADDGGGDGADDDTGTSGGVVDDGNDDTIFDLGQPDAPEACGAPLPVVCDQLDDDPFHAMGINCEGGFGGEVTYDGDARSMFVLDGQLGTSGVFSPRQGEKMVILSTGEAEQLLLTPAELEAMGCFPQFCPSQQFDAQGLIKLPDPIDVRKVAEDRDCEEDPTLVGQGDCSNTLHDQWIAGEDAHDYTEIRLRAVVPEGADAFGYQFAFFTTEYPTFADELSPFNDMYLAWLQSEKWTGNVSFDGEGNPISIRGVFLEYKDDPANGKIAPELAGFAMEGHGGTDWLSTVAPVSPGEEIEVIFAIFDLTDGQLDSAVVLDGFEWTCTDDAPITTPVG